MPVTEEFLWEIAERFLGSGYRYPEIFDLNEGRLQPDGGRLTDPTVVETGMILILPSDASGYGVQYGPLPGSGTTQATTAPKPNPGPTRTPTPTPPKSPSGSGAALPTTSVSASPQPSGAASADPCAPPQPPS